MNNRGRPEKLTDELKRWIANHQRDRKRKLKAPEIRQDLRAFIEKKVREEIADRGLDWAQDLILEEVERRLPGSSRIQKYLRELNPRLEKVSELNTPWHMGCMIEHELPPEAIPYILLAQDYARKYPDPVFNTLPQDPVTARQAQWIARLYTIVGDIHRLKGDKKVRAVASLYRWSKIYATQELIHELSGTPLDTKELDDGLRTGKYPLTVSQQWLLFDKDDRPFSVDPETAKQLNTNGGEEE